MADEAHFVQNFVSETASEHVRTLIPVVAPHTRVSEVRRSLEGTTFESATHIGVCDNSKLVGVLRIEDLLSALPEAKVSAIMDADLSYSCAWGGSGESGLESSAAWGERADGGR
jgi:Mg/Co/Ni transporter MgtE